MTAYTIFKEYIWLMNTIHHAGIRTPGLESCDSSASQSVRHLVSMKTEKQMAMATAEFAERWKGTGNVSQSVRHIVSNDPEQVDCNYFKHSNKNNLIFDFLLLLHPGKAIAPSMKMLGLENR